MRGGWHARPTRKRESCRSSSGDVTVFVMFEVEQNFNLSPDQTARLLTGAEFRHEKTILDTYFDTTSYALSCKDMWLRDRNGRFELKVPADMHGASVIDQYEEIENEEGIRRAIGLPRDGNMSDDLAKNGYQPFCACTTLRKTYLKDGFTIVLDEVSYRDSAWTYKTCEIELLVETREQMPDASRRIVEFARANGLNSEYLLGKVVAYLQHERPKHYDALVNAGVIEREDA